MTDVAFEYSPAPESREIVSLRAENGLFVNGEFVESASGRTFATLNPATEEVLGQVSDADDVDVERAVGA
ncbi:MAG: aldehyde dehydrogenase family protein, partial [Acidimicrobiales bacterium]